MDGKSENRDERQPIKVFSMIFPFFFAVDKIMYTYILYARKNDSKKNREKEIGKEHWIFMEHLHKNTTT